MLLPRDEVVEGVQGGKLEFEIALIDEYGRPIDTTNYDQYKVCIKQSSTSAFEVSQVAGTNNSVMSKVGADILGVFNVLIDPADMANLKDGERQDIHFEMSNSGDTSDVVRLVFKDRLAIFKTACS